MSSSKSLIQDSGSPSGSSLLYQRIKLEDLGFCKFDITYLGGNLVDTADADDEGKLGLTRNIVVATVACLLHEQ